MSQLTVETGDCRISRTPSDVLNTHALGSCIAVALYDPAVRIAGLLHYMLPDSSLDSERAMQRPFLFADTGIRLLVQRICRLGARRPRLIAFAAGGARMLGPEETLDIGARNQDAMRTAFRSEGICVHRQEIGGRAPRSISIAVADGHIVLRKHGLADRELLLNGGIGCSR